MNEFRSQIFGGPRTRESLLGAKKPRGAKAEAGLQSVRVPRAETRSTDTREGDRHRLTGEQVQVVHRRRRYDVELVNLSGGGAMIAGDLDPRLGDRLELHLAEGASLGCIVRWVKGDRTGMEFIADTQIDCPPEQLEGLLRDVVSRSFPEMAIAIQVPVEESEPVTPKSEAQVESEHRRAERIPLVWSAQIHFDFTSTPIRLRNISATGALIECDFALPVGSEPLLDLGQSGQIFATVTWRKGEQIGLAFKEPFDVAQLSRSKPAVAPVWRPPASAMPASSEEEPELNWEEMSPDELRDALEGFLKR